MSLHTGPESLKHDYQNWQNNLACLCNQAKLLELTRNHSSYNEVQRIIEFKIRRIMRSVIRTRYKFRNHFLRFTYSTRH